MPLLTFSPAASAHIQQKLAQKKTATTFRLSVKKTGCSGYMYVLELLPEPKSGDIEVEHGGEFPCFVAPDALTILADTEIDFVSKSLGIKQLVFNNPQAVSLCGCGESFNLRDEDSE